MEELGCELERLGRSTKKERKCSKTWTKELVEVIVGI